MQSDILIGVILAAAMSAIFVYALRPVAHRVGLVDRPSERKAHLTNIPLIGGLGICAAFLISTVVWHDYAPNPAYYAAAGIIVVGGILDDFSNLKPLAKLSFQVAAILVMCLVGGVSIQSVGTFVPQLGPIELGALAIPFTVFVAVGVVNAVNLADGLDGLAGFQLCVAFLALAFLADRAEEYQQVGQLLILVACLSGFLAFNARVLGRKQADVFLGDVGTMFLGFTYVWIAIELSSGSDAIMSPVTALWLLAIPICDTVTMIIRRLSRGRSPFKADKEHLHHVFLMAGFTVGETVMIFTGLAIFAACVGIAATAFGVPDALMILLFIIMVGSYLWVILRAWTVMRFLRRSICRRRAMHDRRTNSERRKFRKKSPTRIERRNGKDRRRLEDRRRSSSDSGTVPKNSQNPKATLLHTNKGATSLTSQQRIHENRPEESRSG